MEFIDLGPVGAVSGSVRLPGSKSISNRVLLLAALAEGRTRILDLLDSDDTRVMLDALAALGVSCSLQADGVVAVNGCGGRFPVRDAELFLGNAGTAFRPLAAVLAVLGGDYRLKGVPRMHERPIADLVNALRLIGADIEYLGNHGFPPLRIGKSGAASGQSVWVRGDVSSQFVTALLLALPLAGREWKVVVEGELISKPYVEITLNLMRRFGVEVARNGWQEFSVPAGPYKAIDQIHVEGDASAASYFLAAGAISGLRNSGRVRVEGVGQASIQGDVRFVEVLQQMGASISMGENWIESGAGDGARASRRLSAIDVDLNHIPDAAMTVAVLALFADGPSTLRNIGSWRVKETDRISAMATELRKLGADVIEGEDFLSITPPELLRSDVSIFTYDDHRMAMCFSLVALGGVRVRILDPNCVNKTFPDYFQVFDSIVSKMRVEPASGCAGEEVPVIAVDGPSASGKGTVAQAVAKVLGFHFLDSGALYRVVALAAMRRGIAWSDEGSLSAIAEGLPVEFSGGHIYLEKHDVTDEIRTEACSFGASKVGAVPAVRRALLERQRAFRELPGLVADGRDMGTVVFPDARLKVFLTASTQARAERRHKQLIQKGITVNISALLKDLQERDDRDMARPDSPLKPSPEAQFLDTTALTAEAATNQVLEWFRGAKGG